MKKIFVIVLTVILVLGMTSCSDAGNAGSDGHAEQEETFISESGQSEKWIWAEADPQNEITDTESAASSADVTIKDANDTSATTEESEMKMTIGDTPVTVLWEENESVDALRKLVSEKPLSIQMSMYGGFEQVGSIGQSLPRNDVQTTTNAGDIVLYSGNQMVVFYGSNSWGYTELGHIIDKSAAELKELLGNGDITITIE